ncbi:MAG: glycosyltransferase [Acidobacteria bacterium]|nr:glycosyltransferase [Acidobacteriota bacterium]
MAEPTDLRPRISLVIPAFNEARYLPRLLDSAEAARAVYARGDASRARAIEIVVADNGSTDGTAALAASRGCVVAPVEKRAIAASRNGGARAARGSILAFVDADMTLHPDTFLGVEETLASPRWVAGSTGCRPERWSTGIAVTFAVATPILWLTRFDTGVVFMRREDYDAVGGYDESMLVAEDVMMLWRLRQHGRRRGARLVRVPRWKTVASMRKFDKYGEWHYFPMLWRGLLLVFRPKKIAAFVDEYWYRPER